MRNVIFYLFIALVLTSRCTKPPLNQSPTADAGSDIILLLPANEIVLNGSAHDDNNEIKSHEWTKVSGPNAFLIENNSKLKTKVTNLVEGVYLFELRVTDKQDASSTDRVEVRVMQDRKPVVMAGNDTTLTLPYSHALLKATVMDNDYDTAIYHWSKIAGPGQANIEANNKGTSRVLGLIEGIYQFELTVTDRIGNTGKDTMLITVKKDTNIFTRDTILQVSSWSCPFNCSGLVINNGGSIVPPGQPFHVYMSITNGWWVVPPFSFGNNEQDLWLLYQATHSIQNGNLIIYTDGDFSGGFPVFKIVY